MLKCLLECLNQLLFLLPFPCFYCGHIEVISSISKRPLVFQWLFQVLYWVSFDHRALRIHSRMWIQRNFGIYSGCSANTNTHTHTIFHSVFPELLLCYSGCLRVIQVPVLCLSSGIPKWCKLLRYRMWTLGTFPASELFTSSLSKGGAETGKINVGKVLYPKE